MCSILYHRIVIGRRLSHCLIRYRLLPDRRHCRLCLIDIAPAIRWFGHDKVCVLYTTEVKQKQKKKSKNKGKRHVRTATVVAVAAPIGLQTFSFSFLYNYLHTLHCSAYMCCTYILVRLLHIIRVPTIIYAHTLRERQTKARAHRTEREQEI